VCGEIEAEPAEWEDGEYCVMRCSAVAERNRMCARARSVAKDM